MRILVVHDYYKQRGGEDVAFEAEADVLERHGEVVSRFAVHNDRMSEMSRARAGIATLWNHEMYERLRARIQRERPAVIHFHNTFPLLSPAVYYAAARERVPVVQTLHNFRLLCANGLLMRNGRVREDCVGKSIGWPAVLHRCYRDDYLASSTVIAMHVLHRSLGSWRRKIDRFIAASNFAREARCWRSP